MASIRHRAANVEVGTCSLLTQDATFLYRQGASASDSRAFELEQFQQKCVAVLRPEFRENKEIEHFRDSEKNGNAPARSFHGLSACRQSF
ncbi:hypothetical protein GFM44_01360 [Rhizobium leguminosarum bv. viciae]|nr:hypothetical protein [Rhizobium leguminosarum bv. viciae]